VLAWRTTKAPSAAARRRYDPTVPAVTHPVLTAAEFAAAMECAGWRAPIELIAGEGVVIAPAGGAAAFAQVELAHRIRLWQGDRGGRVLTDVFVQVGQSFLAPDVAWWSAGREPVIGQGAVTSLPDLVIEILSPATRQNDLGPKREQYLTAGVRELWLVDPAARSAGIIATAGERSLGEHDHLASALLPGLSIPVRLLFA
jgi:Uma2 family endonuclease